MRQIVTRKQDLPMFLIALALIFLYLTTLNEWHKIVVSTLR